MSYFYRLIDVYLLFIGCLLYFSCDCRGKNVSAGNGQISRRNLTRISIWLPTVWASPAAWYSAVNDINLHFSFDFILKRFELLMYFNFCNVNILFEFMLILTKVFFKFTNLYNYISFYMQTTITLLLWIQWTRQFRVSKEINEACLFETKVWWNKTELIVQQIIPPYYDEIQDFLNLKTPFFEYPTASCKFDSCGSHLTVAGLVTNGYF